ncbi:hypothetical protein [Rudanella lutea]|uniref:hypothetical protein n=1 Tax=Rudanella lutea TaxID=451374 RepID=UPI000372DEC3|nr:hypothetical protein [Rudanella lutea]
MKKTSLSALFCLLAFVTLLTGCGKPKTAPVSERIAKAWTARKVDENSTTVFTAGGANNVRPGYTNFRLDLSQSPNVTLVEFDGNRFSGQWEVQGDNRLILKNLTPQPTGTNGTIEFTITNLGDTEVVLTRTTASQKTGGTVNVYTLKNP